MERIFIVSFFFFALCLFISSKDAFGAPVEQEVTLDDGTVLKVLINDPQTPPPHIISAKRDKKNDSSSKVRDDDKSSQNQDIIIHELKYPPPPKMESLTHGDERSEDSSSNNSANTQDIILHEAVWAPPPVMSEKQYGNSVDRMENHRLRRNAETGGNTEEPQNVIIVDEIRPPPPRMESRRRRRNAGTGGNTEKPQDVIIVEEIQAPPPRLESSRLKREDQPDVNVNLANNVSGNYEITTEGSLFTDSQGIAGDNESSLEGHRESNRVSEDRDMNTSAMNESTGIQSNLLSAANVSTTADARNSTTTQSYLNESSAVKKSESSEMHQTYTGNTNISEGSSILDRKNNDTNIISVVDSNNPDVPGGRINYATDKPVDSAGEAGINPEIGRKDVDDADADANKGLQIPDDVNKVINKQVDSAGDAGINPEIGRKDVDDADADADANKGLEIPDNADKVMNKPGDSAGDNSISPEIGSKDVDDADASNGLQIPDDANDELDKSRDFDEDHSINLDSADKKPSDDDKYDSDAGDKDDDAFDLHNNNDNDDENYDVDGDFADKKLSDLSEKAEDEAEIVDEDNAVETNSGKPYSKGELLGSGRSELQRKLVADESQSTHFMSYFLVAVVFVACFYLVFHNRQKIKAYVLEGRSGLRGRRRKVAGGEYRQLSSTEDVLPASDKTMDPKTAYAY